MRQRDLFAMARRAAAEVETPDRPAFFDLRKYPEDRVVFAGVAPKYTLSRQHTLRRQLNAQELQERRERHLLLRAKHHGIDASRLTLDELAELVSAVEELERL